MSMNWMTGPEIKDQYTIKQTHKKSNTKQKGTEVRNGKKKFRKTLSTINIY